MSAGDMYPRPSRETIAAQVLRQQPAASTDDDLDDVVARRDPEPEPQESAVANFGVHLSAKMRALGWDAAKLAEKSLLSQVTITRAISGTSVSLDIAEKLAALVDGYLAAMIGPYVCGTCAGEPPAGFGCLECGTETRTP